MGEWIYETDTMDVAREKALATWMEIVDGMDPLASIDRKDLPADVRALIASSQAVAGYLRAAQPPEVKPQG